MHLLTRIHISFVGLSLLYSRLTTGQEERLDWELCFLHNLQLGLTYSGGHFDAPFTRGLSSVE